MSFVDYHETPVSTEIFCFDDMDRQTQSTREYAKIWHLGGMTNRRGYEHDADLNLTDSDAAKARQTGDSPMYCSTNLVTPVDIIVQG